MYEYRLETKAVWRRDPAMADVYDVMEKLDGQTVRREVLANWLRDDPGANAALAEGLNRDWIERVPGPRVEEEAGAPVDAYRLAWEGERALREWRESSS